MAEQAWQKEAFDVLLEGGVRQIAYVPDAGHAYSIREAISSPEIQDGESAVGSRGDPGPASP